MNILENHNLISSTDKKLLPFYRNIMRKEGPFTILLFPTNKCNMNCTFCGEYKRDKNLELSFDKIKDIMSNFSSTVSVQLTGGGEPLMHKDISKIIDYLYDNFSGVGLVTNGVLLKKLKTVINKLQWLRISVNSLIDYKYNIPFDVIPKDMKLGITYVINKEGNDNWLEEIKSLKNKYKNIQYCKLSKDSMVNEYKNEFIDYGDNIYLNEPIKQKTDGICHLGSIRPIITASGKIYPCCHMMIDIYDWNRLQEISIEDVKNYNIYRCTSTECPVFSRELLVRQALSHFDEDINFV